MRAIANVSDAEHWFQVLLDAAPDAMVVVDQDGKIVLVNTQTERLFGYQRDEILGLDVEVLIPRRLHDQHRGHRKGFFAQPHVRPMGSGLELFGVRKGGGEFPVEVSLSPVHTKEGVLITSAIRDITERKLVEESRFRLAAIVESSEDAIISKNLDAVIMSWNAAAERIFGYTQREAIGRTITILIPSELREEENKILERLRAGERIDYYETIRVTKAGKRVNVSLSLSPVKDATGRIVGFSKIARDITQRKEMDRALRETNAEILERSEQLRLAAQGSQMGLWFWNELTKELYWDAKTREMFGVPVDGEVTLETFYGALHPDGLKWVTKAWRDAFENRLPYELEYRSLSPDGTTRWIYARGSGYYDDAAKPIRMVGVVFDITRRKQIEHEHLELSGRLIKAHEEERSRIARELHDDFSQRVALLATKLQMILDVVGNSQPNVSERVRELVKTVNEFGADVHALSHSLHSSKLEMLGLSRSVSSFCREFSKQHKIEIDVRQEALPEPMPSETALCLFRLVQEGLQNVRKHSRASRVEVRLAGAPTEISLILSDNGVGFDLSHNHASNGIGILSMKERVRMLHGTFEIQSAPMRGTQITVKIPAA